MPLSSTFTGKIKTGLLNWGGTKTTHNLLPLMQWVRRHTTTCWGGSGHRGEVSGRWDIWGRGWMACRHSSRPHDKPLLWKTSLPLSFTLLPPPPFTTSACSSKPHENHRFLLISTKQAAWTSTITKSVTIEADGFSLDESSKPTWGSLSFHSLHIRMSSVHKILCLERSHNANFCLSAHKFLTITNSCGHVS